MRNINEKGQRVGTLAQLQAGEFTNATRITLADNLREFPIELYDHVDTLEVLDLSNNQFTTLPDDFARFHKLKIFFASNNPFSEFPAVLAQCPNLEMIGFKSCQLKYIPDNAFPSKLRWLILTDNQLSELPDCFDHTPRLQKLALAGNQLTHLPASMASCQNLELIRISANQLTEFPEVLHQMSGLAWCAFAGNPFCASDDAADELVISELDEFALKDLLGEGASGHIYLAEELSSGGEKAVKIFKGAVTSDGYPEEEMRASITAGMHPNIVNVQAKINGETSGIVMELIPAHYENLGLPPSLQSCTRDQFAEGLQLPQMLLLDLIKQATSALHHIHQQGLVHGDFYAHNVLIDPMGHLLLGDFGAASHTDSLTDAQRKTLLRIEKRALAHFVEDLWQQATVDEHCERNLQRWHQQLLNDEIELSELLAQISTANQTIQSLIRFCPSCGSEDFHSEDGKHWRCLSCDFQYFHNMAAATAGIIRCGDEILLVRRKFNPGKGMLDLPGGFVDYGESLEAGIAREIAEETGLQNLTWQYLFSFPNQYRYADVLYHTQDAFFIAELESKPNIHAQDDAEEAVWVKLADLDFADIAFVSVQNALNKYLDN